MATSGRAPEVEFTSVIDENAVQIEFIDEGNLPLACIHFMERSKSEEVLGSDFSSESSGGESEEETGSDTDEGLAVEEATWTANVAR